jgi:hypothetical protein
MVAIVLKQACVIGVILLFIGSSIASGYYINMTIGPQPRSRDLYCDLKITSVDYQIKYSNQSHRYIIYFNITVKEKLGNYNLDIVDIWFHNDKPKIDKTYYISLVNDSTYRGTINFSLPISFLPYNLTLTAEPSFSIWEEINWSDNSYSILVTDMSYQITHTVATLPILQIFLELFPNAFPILRHLIGY